MAQHLESDEQRLFVARFRLDPSTRKYPACAVPNGGRRSAREAGRLKAEGVTAGAPDWMLFVPAFEYCGLALEFKSPTGKGRVSASQAAFHELLRAQRWQVHVVTSARDAWAIVTTYLQGVVW